MSVAIRPEATADHAAIAEVTRAAFVTTGHGDGTEAGIVADLRAAGDLHLSLVADRGGTIIGHAAFSPARVGGASGWFGLGPISVRPDAMGQGIGAALIGDGLARLSAQGAAGVVLTGNPAYYTRHGFRNDCGVTYLDLDPKFVHQRVLNGPGARGAITFAPALHGS